MSIHGYKEDGRPMFDNASEYSDYIDVQREQRISNRSKFDWIVELSRVGDGLRSMVSDVMVGKTIDECEAELKEIRNEFDSICEKIEKSPKKRLENTDIVDEYLSGIEVSLT